MRILVQVIDAIGIEIGSATLDAMHFIPLLQEELGKVGAVLTGNAGDQSSFQRGGAPVDFILCQRLGGWYLD